MKIKLNRLVFSFKRSKHFLCFVRKMTAYLSYNMIQWSLQAYLQLSTSLPLHLDVPSDSSPKSTGGNKLLHPLIIWEVFSGYNKNSDVMDLRWGTLTQCSYCATYFYWPRTSVSIHISKPTCRVTTTTTANLLRVNVLGWKSMIFSKIVSVIVLWGL